MRWGVLGLVGIALVLGSAACSFKAISHGTEITDEQIASIKDGSTTKQDVFMEFGNPSKIMDSERVFFYTWTRGSKSSVLGIGGGSAYTYSLAVVFDDKGIVKSHKLTRGDTPQNVAVGD
jgi:outer membrane protein assembly factor BamE (lipoprotein component of BamABCDE complex)